MQLTGQIDIIDSFCANFPWTKLERLLLRPEIMEPQIEDGFSQEMFRQKMRAAQGNSGVLIYLAMVGPKTLGFLSAESCGMTWAAVHLGFKKEVPGPLKKGIAISTMEVVFQRTQIQTLVGFIPRCNKAACLFAYSCGFRREGQIGGTFLKDGKEHDLLIYSNRKAK